MGGNAERGIDNFLAPWRGSSWASLLHQYARALPLVRPTTVALPVGLSGSVRASLDVVRGSMSSVFLLFFFLIVCQLLLSPVYSSVVEEGLMYSSISGSFCGRYGNCRGCGGDIGDGVSGDCALLQFAWLREAPLSAGLLCIFLLLVVVMVGWMWEGMVRGDKPLLLKMSGRRSERRPCPSAANV